LRSRSVEMPLKELSENVHNLEMLVSATTND
jgi:archaellum component FlaC